MWGVLIKSPPAGAFYCHSGGVGVGRRETGFMACNGQGHGGFILLPQTFTGQECHLGF